MRTKNSIASSWQFSFPWRVYGLTSEETERSKRQEQAMFRRSKHYRTAIWTATRTAKNHPCRTAHILAYIVVHVQHFLIATKLRARNIVNVALALKSIGWLCLVRDSMNTSSVNYLFTNTSQVAVWWTAGTTKRFTRYLQGWKFHAQGQSKPYLAHLTDLRRIGFEGT